MNTTNPYAAPRAAVADIPSGEQSAPASRLMRLVAHVLDSIILMAIIYVPLLVGGGAGIFMAAITGGPEPALPSTFGIWALVALLGCIVWIALTIVYVSRNGQTIAKKMLGIKVVRSDGSKASLGRIFWLRNFVNGLLTIVPFYALVDWLFIFGDQRQCLHDKIADTIVIRA